MTSLVAQTVKASAYNAVDLGLIPGLGRSPGEGNGSPLQYCCLDNPMDRGAWQAPVHGVAKSRTQLSDFTSLHFTSLLFPAFLMLQSLLRASSLDMKDVAIEGRVAASRR